MVNVGQRSKLFRDKDKIFEFSKIISVLSTKINHNLLFQIQSSIVTKTVRYIKYPKDWLLKLTLSA